MNSRKLNESGLSYNIRKALIQARKEKGYSQKQVANENKITQSEVSKIETGERQIDILVLAKLAFFYEKRLKDFIPKSLW